MPLKLTKAHSERVWEAIGGGDMGDGMKRGFIAHYEKVRQLAPKERLLEFEVAKDDWTKLATFLDKPIPQGNFPKVNDTATFHKNVNALIVSYPFLSLFFQPDGHELT